jgi:hypothetical protein
MCTEVAQIYVQYQELMAEDPVQSELVSAQFPANSENNRDLLVSFGFLNLKL